MRCAACDNPAMLVLEFERVEIDYCQECGGLWLDSGELALLGAKAGAVAGQLEAAVTQPDGHKPQAGKRPCPVCRAAMDEWRVEGEPPIVLDRCRRGHGLWFDRGEVRRLVVRAGAEPGNVLARFLGELDGPAEPPPDGP